MTPLKRVPSFQVVFGYLKEEYSVSVVSVKMINNPSENVESISPA